MPLFISGVAMPLFIFGENFIKEIMMKKTFYNSPLGKMTILADDEALYGLWFND